MISIGAVVEGTPGVEYCARGEWLSGDDGARSGISMGEIGVDFGVAILFFTVGLGSFVVSFGCIVLSKQKKSK